MRCYTLKIIVSIQGQLKDSHKVYNSWSSKFELEVKSLAWGSGLKFEFRFEVRHWSFDPMSPGMGLRNPQLLPFAIAHFLFNSNHVFKLLGFPYFIILQVFRKLFFEQNWCTKYRKIALLKLPIPTFPL